MAIDLCLEKLVGHLHSVNTAQVESCCHRNHLAILFQASISDRQNAREHELEEQKLPLPLGDDKINAVFSKGSDLSAAVHHLDDIV